MKTKTALISTAVASLIAFGAISTSHGRRRPGDREVLRRRQGRQERLRRERPCLRGPGEDECRQEGMDQGPGRHLREDRPAAHKA